jgi:hypothetical protein
VKTGIFAPKGNKSQTLLKQKQEVLHQGELVRFLFRCEQKSGKFGSRFD